MKLVYLYVDGYKSLKDFEITLTNKYNFTLERDENNNPISISHEENPKYVDFFGNNNEIFALIGKNGSGKSSILEICSLVKMYNPNIFNQNAKPFKYIAIFEDSDEKTFKVRHNIKNLEKSNIYIDIEPECVNLHTDIYYFAHNPQNRLDSLAKRKHRMNKPSLHEEFDLINTLESQQSILSNINEFNFYMQSLLKKDINILNTINNITNLNLKFDSIIYEIDISKSINKIFQGLYNLIFSNKSFSDNDDLILILYKHGYINLQYRYYEEFELLYNPDKKYEMYSTLSEILEPISIVNFISSISPKIKINHDSGYRIKELINKEFDLFLDDNKFDNITDAYEVFITKFIQKNKKSINIDTVDEIINTPSNLSKESIFNYLSRNFIGINAHGRVQTISKPMLKGDLDVHKSAVYLVISYYLTNKDDIDYRYEYLSDGEKTILSLYINMLHKLKAVNNYLLDEPMNGLHPELQRNYINIIDGIIKETDSKNNLIVISSHYPIITSDLPSNNVIYLEKGEDGFTKSNQNGIDNPITFGANLIDSYNDTFHVKYLVGEYARKKILKFIGSYEFNEQLTFPHTQAEIDNFLPIIGDPVIKAYVESQLFKDNKDD